MSTLRGRWPGLAAAVAALALPSGATAQEETTRVGDTPAGAYQTFAPAAGAFSLMAVASTVDVATALDIHPNYFVSANFGTSDQNGYAVLSTTLEKFPKFGDSYLALSSGCTSIAFEPNNSGASGCVLDGLNNSQGNDLVQMTLVLNVPATAQSFAIDWKMFSEEYPEWVGTQYNDAFLVEVGSSTFTISGNAVTAPNNVAFDAEGNLITINTTGVLGMSVAEAANTTYDGATAKLATRANLPAGATSLTLVFSVMDLGDSVYDTMVFLDRFRFSTGTVDDPITEPVINEPPQAVVTPATASADEGGSVLLDGTGSFDPNAGDALTYAWTYAGAGTCAFSDASAAATSFTCNDDGIYTAILTVSDGEDESYATAEVTVSGVAPSIGSLAPAQGTLYAVNTSVTASATYSDPGAGDTHVCTFTWGDGASGTAAGALGGCSASHSYSAAGVYAIDLTVADDDGASATASTMVVVYDPSAGFVTGGGWIWSPAGALTADATVTGKANFGFVSKYQKGATTPTGQTEFRFSAGNLNFHSSSYDWLVIAGHRAMFKGSGTVNGVSGYEFQLTAVDGDLAGAGDADRFRIKIWAAGGVIYDNSPSTGPGDVYSSQEVAGGSIVIHE